MKEQHPARIAKAAGGILLDILIAAIVLAIGLYLFGIRPYVVETGSMEPVLPVGSVCVVNQRAGYDAVQTGDIIVYQKNSGMKVIHRVIAVTENGLETKGDANDASDGVSTTRENFVGRNLFHIPRIGFLVKWLQTPQGIIMSIAVVCVIAALGLTFGKGKRNEQA